jgi:holliday junction DNA helicase RuvA
MIGRIRGILLENEAPDLLIEASGVGYEIHAPLSTCMQLPSIGEEAIVHTHLSVSENAQSLYGFISLRDRRLFRDLIKVSGIGPKLALGILSGMATDEFIATINAGDANLLVKIPGVGKKTAERLVIEMRDKLKTWEPGTSNVTSLNGETSPLTSSMTSSSEVQSALLALGYKPQDASRIVAKLAEQVDFDSTPSEELIRLALKGMAQ